jgi:uncharacterized damage-inducible protein DinB
MTKTDIQLLYEYDRWANFRTIEVVAPLTSEQLKKNMDSSFESIHGTLVHILSADKIWLDRWTGKTPAPLKADSFPAIEALKKQWDMYYLEIGNFMSGLTDDVLLKPLRYTDFRGNVHDQPLCLQMQHKVNHTSYHRGQIVTMLRQLNVKPVGTDFINFLRQKEAPGSSS